jgi:CheY-like chemotaxis protein
MRSPTKTILVVEDDEIIRDISSMILEEEGYRVVTAEDGRHALEILGELPAYPDLALVDWAMPVMSGAELLLAMQASPYLSRIPVLVCSAQRLTLELTLGGIPVRCLTKPIDPPTLVDAVGAALAALGAVATART